MIKDMQNVILWLAFAGVLLSCVCPAPKMDGDRVVSNADGSTSFGRTTPGDARRKIDAALNSKGFKRYKANVAQQSAKHWIDLSFYAGIATALFLIAWYFTKIKEMGGAAILCVCFSFFAVIMAELVSMAGKITLGIVGITAIVLGLAIRDKSLFAKIKGKLWPLRD